MRVRALTEIRTEKGLLIASADQAGVAVRGAQPQQLHNVGKVLVYFSGRQKGYWVPFDRVLFPSRTTSATKSLYRGQSLVVSAKRALPVQAQPYTFDFGQNLKAWRQARQLSQAELGVSMGQYGVALAQSTICYRERCAHSPGGQFVQAAAQALQIPAYVLFMNFHNCALFQQTQQFMQQLSSSVYTAEGECRD